LALPLPPGTLCPHDRECSSVTLSHPRHMIVTRSAYCEGTAGVRAACRQGGGSLPRDEVTPGCITRGSRPVRLRRPRLAGAGLAVIVVTHDEQVAGRMAMCLRMADGCLSGSGSTARLPTACR
jgi:hypothetical protein